MLTGTMITRTIALMCLLVASGAETAPQTVSNAKDAAASPAGTPANANKKGRRIVGTRTKAKPQHADRGSNRDYILSHHKSASPDAHTTEHGNTEVSEEAEIATNEDDMHTLYRFGFGSNLKLQQINKVQHCDYNNPKTLEFCPPMIDPRIQH